MISLQGSSTSSASIVQNATQQQQSQQSCGAPNSIHLAKIEANHNRRAMHRRTQSQFEFKNCSSTSVSSNNSNTGNAKNQIQTVTGNAVENNIINTPQQQHQQFQLNNGFQQTNLSPMQSIQQQQQQQMLQNQGNLLINMSSQQQQQQQYQVQQFNQLQQQQQQQQQQPQFSQSQLYQQKYQNQFSQQSQQLQVSQPSQVSPADSLQSMIQLMQAKQQSSERIQQQIVEPIEQDFMKFQSQNTGFHFGKKIQRLYPSQQQQLFEATGQQQQTKQIDPQVQQQQFQQQQHYQQLQSSQSQLSSSPLAYGIVSPFSSSTNPSFFANSGQLMCSNLGLQPIPEQNDITSGDYAMVSHPSSTKNMSNPEEIKKQPTHFHSHSSSLSSNPINNPSSPSQLCISPSSSSHHTVQSFHKSSSNLSQLFSNSLGPTTSGQQQQLLQVVNQGTQQVKESKVSSARDHYQSDESQIAQLTSNATPKVISSFGQANTMLDKKFFSSAKKQAQVLQEKQIPQQIQQQQSISIQQQLSSSSPSKQSPRYQQNISAVVLSSSNSTSSCSSAMQTTHQQQHLSKHKKNSSWSDKDLDQSMKAIQTQWLQIHKYDQLKQLQQSTPNSIAKDSNNNPSSTTVPHGLPKTTSAGLKTCSTEDGENIITSNNNNNNNKYFQAGQIAYFNGKNNKRQQASGQQSKTATTPVQTAMTRSYNSGNSIQQYLSNSSLSATQQQHQQQTHMHSVSSQQLRTQQLDSSQILQPSQSNTTQHKRKISAANSSTISGQQQPQQQQQSQQQQKQPYLFQNSPQAQQLHQPINTNESLSTAGLVLINKFSKSSQSTGQLGQQQQQQQQQPKTSNVLFTNTKSIVNVSNDMNGQNSKNMQQDSSNSSRSSQDQTKICQLESIVLQLHERMHQLEETNSFLIHKIKNLLEEKQSDKKIQVIEDQTKLNNDHISAIRKLIATKSSSLQVKQESSTHILTETSENESPQADDSSQQCLLLSAKEIQFDGFQNLLSLQFFNNSSDQQQSIIAHHHSNTDNIANNCYPNTDQTNNNMKLNRINNNAFFTKEDQLRQNLPTLMLNNNKNNSNDTNEVAQSQTLHNQLKPPSVINRSTPQLSAVVQQAQNDQQKNHKKQHQQQQRNMFLNS